MRGIDRVLAVVLLLGAVGGAAAFARHSGSDSTARTVDLAAPPLQHVTAPGTVVIAPTPAPSRVRAGKVAPARRVTLPQVTLPRPVQAVEAQKQVQLAPPPKPDPAAVATAPQPVQAPPAPVPTPEPQRSLAVAQPAPVQPEPVRGKSKGHGHGWGQLKHDDSAPAPVAPAPDTPVVLPPAADSGGDQHRNTNDQHGNGNGDEHGHGSGHDQNGGPQHSGD